MKMIVNQVFKGEPSPEEVSLRVTNEGSFEIHTIIMRANLYALFENVYPDGLPEGIILDADTDEAGNVTAIGIPEKPISVREAYPAEIPPRETDDII